MVESFAVVVHACRRVKLSTGQSVLVCGAGPIGIMMMMCAKAFGASKVFITDILKSRLDMAKQLGADGVYLMEVCKNSNDNCEPKIAANIVELMGEHPDVSIDCTGVSSSQSIAIYATKSGGNVGIVGLGRPSNQVPLSMLAMREINLIGVCRIKDE